MAPYNDGDVEDHARDVAGLVDPEGDDELPQSGAEGVGQAAERRGGHAAPVGKPEVRVAGGRGEHERLREPGEDLAEHDHAEQTP